MNVLKKIYRSAKKRYRHLTNKKYRLTGICKVEEFTANNIEYEQIIDGFAAASTLPDNFPDGYGGKRLFETHSGNGIFVINNGRLDTDNAVSDAFISEKNLLVPGVTFTYTHGRDTKVEDNNIFSRYIYSPAPTFFDKTVFSLLSGGGATFNYYHWLYDVLPRLYILENSSYKGKVDLYLVKDFGHAFKKETFQIMGIQSEQVIDSLKYGNIIARKIVGVMHPNSRDDGREIVPKFIVEFLRSTFLLHSKWTQAQEPPKKIYISRSKASMRRLTNEEQLLVVLRQYGFTPVYLEGLSFKEQVHLFKNAEFIICPHGAGLSNLAFCNPHTNLLELFPPDAYIPLYYLIGEHVKMDYNVIVGTRKTFREGFINLHQDFEIDVNKVKAFLKKKLG